MKLDQEDMQEILKSLKVFNALKDYNFLRFHMPGHKAAEEIFLEPIKNIYPQLDVTETHITDDLLCPKSYIREFLDSLQKYFNAECVFLSLQGSTHLLQSSIAYFCKPYDTILINRDAHKSIYNIAKILRLDIEFVYPKFDKRMGIFTYIDLHKFEDIIKSTKSQVVLITSPSYYGINQDVENISKIAKKYNKKLIVDQAHGAYFKFVGKDSALDKGADICIVSLHKTLPCPNQSALLLANDRTDTKRLYDFLGFLHTSSPSYVLLAWSEYGIEFSKRFAKVFWNQLEEKLNGLATPIKEFTNYIYPDVDISKLLINYSAMGISQERITELFRNYGIVPELFDKKRFLLYFSFIDALNNFENLKMFFYDIIKEKGKMVEDKHFSLPIPQKALKIYETLDYKKKKVKLRNAQGMVCANAIIPYPPGFPILVEGEIISKEIIDYLKEFYQSENVVNEEVEVIDEG